MHVVTQRNCLKILVKVKSRLLLPSCTENSLYNVKNSNAEKCLLIKIYYMNKKKPTNKIDPTNLDKMCHFCLISPLFHNMV